MIVTDSQVPSIYITKLSTSVTNWPNIRPLNRGRIKSGAARQICGQILADFVQKWVEKGKFVFLLFLSLIIAKSINYYTFPTDIDKDSFVSKGKCLQKGKITILSCRIFPPNQLEKSAKSWQHCYLQ